MTIEIRKLTTADYSLWDEYINRKKASLYHDSRWINLIQSVFGQTSHHILASENNQIVGALPITQLKSFLFGNYMVSMPYFNYGGVVADSTEIAGKLISHASQLSNQLGCSHLEMRFDEEQNSELPSRTDKVTMLLDLPEDPDELWKAIGSKRRAQVKRPIREGVEFVHGGIELLDDFYYVFTQNMRDLGTPVYSKKFFQSILKTFPEQTIIAIVKLNDEAVGTGFLIGNNGTLEIPWASTLRKVNKIGVNMFLYWNILKTAIEQEYKVFDFGRSSKDAGTLRFKKQWGAVEKQLYWYYAMKDEQPIPQMNHSNAKYQLMINTWKKMPVSVCNFLGPYIVRGLP